MELVKEENIKLEEVPIGTFINVNEDMDSSPVRGAESASVVTKLSETVDSNTGGPSACSGMQNHLTNPPSGSHARNQVPSQTVVDNNTISYSSSPRPHHLRVSTTNSSTNFIVMRDCVAGGPSDAETAAGVAAEKHFKLSSSYGLKHNASIAFPAHASTAMIESLVKSKAGSHLLMARSKKGVLMPADISDAVAKILEDYDWSQIPLANSDRRKVHVKRPMNAFMVWAQEARRKLSGQHRQVHNAELSKSLGRIWRGMSDGQKKPFIERAEQLRKKHKQEYPDYKYQPRRRKENVKSVSGEKGPASSSCVNVQDLSTAQHYVSLKNNSLNLAMNHLSPPHSPSAAPPGSRHHDHHHHIQEQVFVGDCLTDTFDAIDRAEMNKYLLPDQNGMLTYAHPSALNQGGAPGCAPHYTPMTSMAVSVNGTSSPMGSNLSAGPSSSGSLPPLQTINHPRLVASSPGFSSSPSPYYTTLGSPQEILGVNSPENTPVEIIGSSVSPVGSGGSPEPHPEYVELQPSKPQNKDESLSTGIGGIKSPVNHFIPQCYTQHYPYNYSYTYPMWHG